MISAQKLEVRAGARLLMHDVSFRVGPGDKVGLVGRNGAGKTTLTRILAGDGLPAAGEVHSTNAATLFKGLNVVTRELTRPRSAEPQTARHRVKERHHEQN